MLHLVLLASAVIGLGQREGIVAATDHERYATWLWTTALDMDAQRNAPRCAEMVVTSTGVTGLQWVDQIPTDPYVVHQGDPIFGKTIKIPQTMAHQQVGGIEHLTLEGCGRVRHANILVNAVWSPKTGRDTGAWRARDMMDGDSLAEPRLQQDVTQRLGFGLAQELRKAQPACTLDDMRRTYHLGAAKVVSPLDAARAWSEVWPLSVCGKDYAPRIDFKPNPAGPGTQFVINLEPEAPKSQPSQVQ